MKIRKLKKQYSSKLDRLWIKHLVEWKQLNTEYRTIRLYYIESIKKQYINLWENLFFKDYDTFVKNFGFL